MKAVPDHRDPVRHAWACTRRGPFTETIATSTTAHATIVTRCEECHGTDEDRAPGLDDGSTR